MEPLFRKVLVIEDESSIRNLLFGLIAQLGCTADSASDGREALAKLSREKFDSVLLDLRCSRVQADDVIPEIHRICPSLVGRVLVITGEVEDDQTLRLIEDYFLLRISNNSLSRDVLGFLRALLGISPSPRAS
jgi:CheY-like chemotaxis protein